jgi:glycosyltransferase involved in cell wall biosynthesis
VSLHGLVKGLLRIGCEPMVLLASSNPYVSRFRNLGMPVVTMDVRQGQGVTYSAPIEQVRSSTLADWARRTGPAAAIWHGGGSFLRFWRRMLPQALEIRRRSLQLRAELIHCNDALSISRAAVIGARLARLPCICHVRRFDRLGRFERWLARYVDQFIFISRAVQHQFAAQGATAKGQRVVHNGVDLEEFPLGVDGEAVRRELGMTGDGPVVGIVGRLVGWKGHHVFLRALAQVAEAVPNVRGLIVGGAEVTNPYLAEELEQLSDALGLRRSVHFTGHRQDVARMVAAMDVLTHTSTAPEPFGRVLIEGMAMGKPLVASASGAVPEIVLDGETGLLVQPGDSQAFAAAITSLLRDPDRATLLGAAGRRRVEQRFTLAHHVRQVRQVYGDMLGDR